MLTAAEQADFVIARYDPDLVCEFLQLTTRQLVLAFPDELEANWSKFEEVEGEIEIWNENDGE